MMEARRPVLDPAFAGMTVGVNSGVLWNDGALERGRYNPPDTSTRLPVM